MLNDYRVAAHNRRRSRCAKRNLFNQDIKRHLMLLPVGLAAYLFLMPSVSTAVTLNEILRAVAAVESGDRDVGQHTDGVSFGRYGVTQMAVDELHRVGRLNSAKVDLRDPVKNRRIAKLYLVYLKHRHGSWWKAVQQYNPGSSTYAKTVWAAIDRQRSKVTSPAVAKR